ncbi:magnesium transporter [Periweissella cryptocerci]|uniref:Magnesium transporter MgtE n=1 Tax=Periweissella cryptocerci TaxID=2506420 RepID=A0A4P6YRT3_9LACO|nr:magnesium transporter [Periweissella cryptocerci]QBO35303.1 magnesium transporter [Periweissella cryptocerci]
MDEIREEIENQTTQLADLVANQRLVEFKEAFLELHSYEQAQIYYDLAPETRHVVIGILTDDELAEVFDALEEEPAAISELLEEMSPRHATHILNKMFTDNVADILGEMDADEVATYLSLMPKDDANELRQLIEYDDETAGALLATEYLAIDPNYTVGEAMQYVKKEANEAETIFYLYVVDEAEQLVGVVSLRDLLTHPDALPITEITNTRVIAAHPADDQEDVAMTMRDYDFMALPVTDHANHMIGIITIDDIVDVIDEEAASDYSGLAGVDVEIVDISPLAAAKKRLPWLIALLFLGMSTASLISHYEALVSQAAILAVFISLITGTAGNAGTQSLAVAVRKIALNEENPLWKVILTEITIGLLIGVITGVTIFLIVGFWKANWFLGLAIGISMMAAITVANLAGSLIPMGMNKIGVDPAVASGPFISTLSDLTSVLIYFSIAQIFLSNFVNQH